MLKKIASTELRLGMHIHELCGSWMEHPFWRSRFTLADPADIRRVIDSGIREVWIDVGKGLDVGAAADTVATQEDVEAQIDDALVAVSTPAPEPAESAAPVALTDAPPRSTMQDEVRRAARICETGKQAVVSMFNEARMGNAVSSEVAGLLVDEISASVMRNPGALISLARLKTADDYTYMHSVAVCALMVALARQLGFDETQTRDAGMAGLLHDLGKAMIPLSVLNKPGKLTDEEFSLVKGHPAHGHQLLVEGGTVGTAALDVVLHHHEKMDGSGYPHGLRGDAISILARMGAICDVYDAITSNRPYKAGWDPAESIRKMTEWTQGHFDQRLFHAFVKSIGIYPVGSLVRLQSGRLGVVVEQSETSLLAPFVMAFYSVETRAAVTPKLINLAACQGNDKIISREDGAEWGIRNADQYWLP